MAISHINTTEVANIAHDMLKLTEELDETINTLYKLLTEVPDVTQEWVGGQAQFYFNKVATEKQQYLDLSNQIKAIANELNATSNEMQGCISHNNNEESRRGD